MDGVELLCVEMDGYKGKRGENRRVIGGRKIQENLLTADWGKDEKKSCVALMG